MNELFRFLNRMTASTWWLRLLAVLGTVLADLLFYRQPAGWTCGAFLLLVGLLLVMRPAPTTRRAAMYFALFVLATAASAVAYCGGALGVGLALLALGALVAARMDDNVWHADLWALAELRAAARIPLAWLHDQRLLRRRSGATRRAATASTRAAAKWFIPIILTGVFLWLFCLANPLIERGIMRAIEKLGNILLQVKLPEFTRILFWCAVAVGLWGVWRVRAKGIRRKALPPPLPSMSALQAMPAPPCIAPTPVQPENETGLVLRCLGLFNALFALETVVDFIYLWGGRALPEGMTYASYAHRGAYPLVATALLSAGLTLLFFRPGRASDRHPAARVLVFAWLAQNVLLTASAAWRLHLYVNVYTLTELRVATFVWMGLVTFGLVAIACRIAWRKDNRWLLDVNTVVLLAVLLACAWWPIKGFVANHNFRYCREAGGPGPALDLAYLHRLGPEAIPGLRAYARLDTIRRVDAARLADSLADELREQSHNPRAWTWRRAWLAAYSNKY